MSPLLLGRTVSTTGVPEAPVMISIPSHMMGRGFPVTPAGSEDGVFWSAGWEEPNTLLRPNAAAAITRAPIATGSTHGRTERRGRRGAAGSGGGATRLGRRPGLANALRRRLLGLVLPVA